MYRQFFKERVGVELLDVIDAGSSPFSGQEHHGSGHGRNTGGVAYTLRPGFFVGMGVVAVVPDVVGLWFTVLDAANAATDAGLANVIFTK